MNIKILRTLSLLAITAFSLNANAQDQKEGTDPSGKAVTPMKVGIVDFAGTYFTHVQARRAPSGEWVPRFQVMVYFPGFAAEDALIVQFKKGKKKIGKPWSCSAKTIIPHFQDNQTTPVYSAGLVSFECSMPSSYAQKKAGSYSLDLSIRQTLQEKTTALGSLPLKTINIKHGSQNNPQTIQTELNDSLVGSAFVYEAPLSSRGIKGIAATHHRAHMETGASQSTNLNIVFWSKNDKASAGRRYTAACLYKGKKVASRSNGGGSGTNLATNYWSYVGKKGKENISWKAHVFQMYALRIRHKAKADTPNNNAQWHYLDQNPGTYECKFMADGAILGSVKFDVQDGAIVKNACQSEINTPDNVYIVPFKDKGTSTVKLDKKLQKRIFNGPRSWSKSCPPR